MDKTVGPSLFVPLARLMGFKVVIIHHGPDYQRQKWNKIARFILRLGEKWGCSCANAVICVAEPIAQDIRKKYNRGVEVIPNGVALPKLKSEIASSAPLALPRNDTGMDSRFRGNDKWKLVIVGDADHEDAYSLQLKKRAQENKGTGAQVILTGFLSGEPLQELYSNAGLFVLPSYYEGLPIVLLEAMSYGLSCLVSDIPANREVELSEDRFFKPGDVQALALKIKDFMDKPLSEEERAKQVEMISEKYNWEKIAQRTLEVYDGVLG